MVEPKDIKAEVRTVIKDCDPQIRAAVEAWIKSPECDAYIAAKVKAAIDSGFSQDNYRTGWAFEHLKRHMADAIKHHCASSVAALEASFAVIAQRTLADVARDVLATVRRD